MMKQVSGPPDDEYPFPWPPPRPWWKNRNLWRLVLLVATALAAVGVAYYASTQSGESNEERLEQAIRLASGVSIECDLLEYEDEDVVRGICFYRSSACYLDFDKPSQELTSRTSSPDCLSLAGRPPPTTP